MADDLQRQQLERALQACADEPIRYSGAIQPHGYLVSCDARNGIVQHVSRNCRELFEADPGELIGRDITELILLPLPMIGADDAARAAASRAPGYVGTVNLGPQARFCDVSVHLAQGLLHLEIEPQSGVADVRQPVELVHDRIARIGPDAVPDAHVHAHMAQHVRELTGFDRVMVYRFLDDGSGEVIAESLAEGVLSYLGLRYPASDIPAQARALYLRNRVRVIPDVDYVPVPIEPAQLHDGTALDLSLHALRSVSPVHLDYMRNMGMAASMSVSIVVDGRLWGLIACHHRTPRRLPPRHRTAADLLGMFHSLRVASMQHLHDAARKGRTRAIRTGMIRVLATTPGADVPFTTLLPELRELIAADAAVHVHDDHAVHDGEPVQPATVDALRQWLAGQYGAVIATDTGSDWRDPTGTYAGVLVLRLPAGHAIALLRREQVHDVDWAGEPVKHLVQTDDGVRLAPRRSFNTWRETVRGHSRPWDRESLDDAESIAILLAQALTAT